MNEREVLNAFAQSARETGGLNQTAQIAVSKGVSRRTFFYVLKGEVSPRLDNLLVLLDIVGLELVVRRKGQK